MDYSGIDWEDLNQYNEVLNLPREVWKPFKVCDLDDRYMVSNYGRCKRMPYKETGRLSLEHIMRITDNGNGYKKFALHTPSGLKNVYVHRAVAELFLGNPDNLPQVNHKTCGLGKHDNRSWNLEWVTCSDNIRDAHNNGQMVNRTNKGNLTFKEDWEIKAAYVHYKENGGVGATAKLFGMPRTTFSSIVNKRSKRHITDPIDEFYKK